MTLSSSKILGLLATGALVLTSACTTDVQDDGSTSSALDLAGAAAKALGPDAKPRPRIAFAHLVPAPKPAGEPPAPPDGEALPPPPMPRPMIVPFALPEPPADMAEAGPPDPSKPKPAPRCVVFRPEPLPPPPACGPHGTGDGPGAPKPIDGPMPAAGSEAAPNAALEVSDAPSGAFDLVTTPKLDEVSFEAPGDLAFTWSAKPEPAPGITIVRLAVFDAPPAPPPKPGEMGPAPKPILPDVVVECVAPPGETRVVVPRPIVEDLIAKHGEGAAAQIAIAHFPPPPKPGGTDAAPPPKPAPDACAPPKPIGHGVFSMVPLHRPKP